MVKLTDEQLIKLLVCQAQGHDGYYAECDKLPHTGGYDCFQFCPFGVSDSSFLNDAACHEEALLMLMYTAAKRLAELTGSNIEIKMPYGRDDEK